MLNFWATWCGPCQEELPLLARLSSAYGGEPVRFVAVSIDEEKSRAQVAALSHRAQHQARHLDRRNHGDHGQIWPGRYRAQHVDPGSVRGSHHADYRRSTRGGYPRPRRLVAERPARPGSGSRNKPALNVLTSHSIAGFFLVICDRLPKLDAIPLGIGDPAKLPEVVAFAFGINCDPFAG